MDTWQRSTNQLLIGINQIHFSLSRGLSVVLFNACCSCYLCKIKCNLYKPFNMKQIWATRLRGYVRLSYINHLLRNYLSLYIFCYTLYTMNETSCIRETASVSFQLTVFATSLLLLVNNCPGIHLNTLKYMCCYWK